MSATQTRMVVAKPVLCNTTVTGGYARMPDAMKQQIATMPLFVASTCR